MTAGQALANILVSLGFLTLVIPFVLVFTILYGMFKKMKLFGDSTVGGRVNLILAFSFALAAVSILADQQFLTSWTQGITLAAIGSFMLLAIAGLGGVQIGSPFAKFLFVAITLAVLLWLVFTKELLAGIVIPQHWLVLGVIVVIFGLVLWYVLRNPEEEEET